jgi:hypothetical protein
MGSDVPHPVYSEALDVLSQCPLHRVFTWNSGRHFRRKQSRAGYVLSKVQAVLRIV